VITGSAASALDEPVAATSGSDCVGSAALVEPLESEGVVALVAAADALESVLEDVVELVWAPPLLCAIPDRGSAVNIESSVMSGVGEAVLADEVVESGEDGGDDNPLGDGLDAESADELDSAAFGLDDEDDDEESDDDGEELESGSANAMPGMVATVTAIPTATVNTPTRPMNFALPTMIPPSST
jgi:hypothetical protein